MRILFMPCPVEGCDFLAGWAKLSGEHAGSWAEEATAHASECHPDDCDRLVNLPWTPTLIVEWEEDE
jgi:hypothetical protein